ncbi:uncharacterized protein N7479_006011 [Penicillium vulpinum]|uniref:Uncharacterized protein n=1 Tax=Penicillium vulpinum TaxID=29845 RepID=A0A1V6SF81_9EURO|nr:uncharacterized protein N7479_006011 [Penicillium vulpinum]KAJ5958861.1 hypothetical protein N7479_006011 [Penicillium vulpinum]OQE12578.1 hypothetical protein PENVUL_c001G05024 [Penicillium vulpinum]
MDDRDSLTEVSDPVGARGVSLTETDVNISPFITLQHKISDAYRKYTGYGEIIAKEGPLAPQFSDLISWFEMERAAARIFSEPRPRIIDGNVNESIEWTDVLREAPTPGHFQLQENGMYRCRVRGSLIELDEANYIEILAGVTEPHLQPLNMLSDEQKETRVRLKLFTYLNQTHQSLIQFANAVHTSLNLLDPTPPIHAASSSSTKNDGVPQLQIPGVARNDLAEPETSKVSQINHIGTPQISDETAGLRLYKLAIEASRMSHSNNFNAGSVGGNIPSSMDNTELGNTNTNANANVNSKGNSNANTKPSGLTSEMTSHSAQSKGHQAESLPMESGSNSPSRPQLRFMRYSQFEKDEGRAFLKSLIDKGSTGPEIELEYYNMFGASRSMGALLQRFKMKGSWALYPEYKKSKD